MSGEKSRCFCSGSSSVSGTVCCSVRGKLLMDAKVAVEGDRNNQYGPPTQDFERTAALWSILFAENIRVPFDSSDVAKAMIALKLSRLTWQNKRDSFLDIAGYAGCGWECAREELIENGDYDEQGD